MLNAVSGRGAPKRTARKHTAAVEFSPRSLRLRIFHGKLKFHPYKLAIVQILNPREFIALLAMLDDVLIFFSDEDLFHLSECVNKQDMRYLSSHNPKDLQQSPMH